jgi:hypothetical protein
MLYTQNPLEGQTVGTLLWTGFQAGASWSAGYLLTVMSADYSILGFDKGDSEKDLLDHMVQGAAVFGAMKVVDITCKGVEKYLASHRPTFFNRLKIAGAEEPLLNEGLASEGLLFQPPSPR